jgi:hypothetical protein
MEAKAIELMLYNHPEILKIFKHRVGHTDMASVKFQAQ